MSKGDKAHRPREPDYQEYVRMERLLEKLKLLNYEHVVAKHNLKYLNRHYFVASPYLPSNPEEQFRMFSVVAAWLINTAGRSFPAPEENDNPTATASNILAELRALGVKVDFQPSDLKQGSGEFVCFVLDQLADKALKKSGFFYGKPIYPLENTEDEFIMEDEAELTFDNEEDEISDYEEENKMDQEALSLRSTHNEADEILESTVDPAEWALEVERVLPQLTAPIETDNKDWRSHVDQMHQHTDRIESSLEQAKSFLHKLQEVISNNMKKLSRRENSINLQLKDLIQEYRDGQAKMTGTMERYEKADGWMAERSRVLTEVNGNLRKAKKQMEEKGSSMSDKAPVVKINQSLVTLNQEIADMDVRIGVLQHMLLQVKLKEKHNTMCDMYATNVPDPAAEPFSHG